MRWPGKIKANRTSAEMASVLDLYTTLIKAAGAKLPEYELDGYDLMPFLMGKTEESPRKSYLYFGHKGMEALRDGAWKLRTIDGTELFNLEIDPAERYNRAEELPEMAKRLSEKLEALTAQATPSAD